MFFAIVRDQATRERINRVRLELARQGKPERDALALVLKPHNHARLAEIEQAIQQRHAAA